MKKNLKIKFLKLNINEKILDLENGKAKYSCNYSS